MHQDFYEIDIYAYYSKVSCSSLPSMVYTCPLGT